MKISSSFIKDNAIKLGFHKVGIAKASKTENEKNNLESWLDKGYQGSMNWISKRKNERGDIFSYYPEAKSVIVLALNYNTGFNQNDLSSNYKISKYAWGEDYHLVLKSKLYKLLKIINDINPDIKGVVCSDTSPIMEKVWAQKAGLGWQGKHTNLITRDYGSWVFLGEIILDIDLDIDLIFDDDLCGSCTACIDACPTSALTDYQIDSNKCISYLTIENRAPIINEDLDLDNWIYGCDICQEVCPWNGKRVQISNDQSFYPRENIVSNEDEDWENLDEDTFKNIFRKSAVKRTKFSGLKRNISANKN